MAKSYRFNTGSRANTGNDWQAVNTQKSGSILGAVFGALLMLILKAAPIILIVAAIILKLGGF